MINVSQAVREALNQDSRNFQARLLKNGTTNVTGNIRSLKIMRGTCGGEEFNLGIVYCPYITAVIDYENLEMEELDGVELLAQIGVNTGTLESPTYSYINMGKYTVIKPQKQGSLVYLTAYGRLSTYFNDEYTDDSEQTIATVLTNIMQTAGVPYYVKGNMDRTQRVSGLAGWKNIEVLQIIAGLLGCCVTEMRNGGIVLATPDAYLEDTGTTATAQIVDVRADEFNVLPTMQKNDSALSGITCFKSISPDDESAQAFVYGDGEYHYANEYMTQAIFDAMCTNIGGYTYRAGTLEIAHGDPTIDPYDAIRYTDGNTQYVVPCMGMELIYDGGIALNVSSAGRTLADETGGFSGVLSQRVARTVAKAEEAQQTADEALGMAEATNQYFWHVQTGSEAGAHITEIPKADFEDDPDNGGGNLFARSNGIAVRDGLTDLATFGAGGSAIGKEDESQVLVDYHSYKMIDKEGDEYAYIGDLRDASGVATITAKYTYEGKTLYLSPLPSQITSVKVNDTEVTNWGNVGTQFFFNDPKPATGSAVEIIFETESQNAKAYTLGKRTGSAGALSMVEGINCEASAYASHAEGGQTKARGFYAHAEGSSTEAKGANSHAEGSATKANGGFSHAEGANTEANGEYSHAQNYGTKANAKFQTVIGKWNTPIGNDGDTQQSSWPALIIGNGSSDNNRSNAFEVDWDGTVKASGEVYKNSADKCVGASVLTGTFANKTVSSGLTDNTVLGSVTLPAGTYVIIGEANFGANATGVRTLSWKNSSDSAVLAVSQVVVPAVNSNSVITRIQSVCIVATNGATYNFNVRQNSGSALTVSGAYRILKLA